MITLSQAALVQTIVGQVTSTYGVGSVTNIGLNVITNTLTLDFQIGSTSNGVFIPAPQQAFGVSQRTRVTINLTTGAWSGGGNSGTLSPSELNTLQSDTITLQNDSESYATGSGVVLGQAVATALPVLTANPAQPAPAKTSQPA
jgi:hypothetical protein